MAVDLGLFEKICNALLIPGIRSMSFAKRRALRSSRICSQSG